MAQHRRIVGAIMVATVATVYPGFLIGALAVQASQDFEVSEAVYGWGLGGFFLAATAGSVVLGRLAQRVGPRRQILTGLAVTVAMDLFIAFGAGGWWPVVAALAVCGLVNASNQTAVNLALTQAEIPRLGLAIALKQSGMPTASMVSGLMVPAVALTVGWRWAYVLGAALAAAAIVLVVRVMPSGPPSTQVAAPGSATGLAPTTPATATASATATAETPTAVVTATAETPTAAVTATAETPTAAVTAKTATTATAVTGPPGLVSSRRELVAAAVAGGCLSFAAGALNAWVVASGVDAGLGEATAGLMLSLGAGTGISLRVLAGTRLDRMRRAPFLVAGVMVLFGAAGMVMLAVRSPSVHVVATLIAFAGGWVWPVFTNYGIVRTNAAAAGTATGITQMGVYVGVFAAPLVTGWLIEGFGYEIMWSVVTAMTLLGSVLALSMRNRF